MPLASDLRALLVNENIDDAIITVIETIGFCSISEFSGIGESENAVNSELIDCDEMKAAKPNVVQRSRIRAAWALCRKTMTADAAGAKGASQTGFVEGTEERLYKTNLETWKHNPQGTRLLNTSGLVKLYTGLQRSPKALEIMPLESIRLKSDIQIKKLEGTLLTGGGELVQVGADLQEFPLGPLPFSACARGPRLFAS